MSDNIFPKIEFEIERTEIVPRARRLPLSMKIYAGSAVKDSKNKKILKNYNDIKRESIVTIDDAFNNIRKAKCWSKKGKDKPTYAEDTKWEYASYTLEFDKDDRHCWVCTSTNHVSKDVLKMLNNEIEQSFSENPDLMD